MSIVIPKEMMGDGVPLGPLGSPEKVFPDERKKYIMIDITGLEEPIHLPKMVENLIADPKKFEHTESFTFITKDGKEVEFVRRHRWAQDEAGKLLYGLNSVTWYNNLAETVFRWRSLPGDKLISPAMDWPDDQYDQLEMLWMIAVSMFGNYGTSPRSGWIEDVDGFREWCLEITEIWRGSDEYNGPEKYRLQ